MKKIIGLTLAGILFMALSGFAQTFTPGNIAVFVATASANNTTGSIMEFNNSTAGQVPTNVYAIDGTGPNAMRFSGSATSTAYLANSNDGTLLAFMGANNTTTSSNANTLNPRAVGTLNAAYTFSIATTYTGTSGNQTRCATTLDNANWYIADQGGIYTNGTNAPSPTGNVRGIKSFGGNVYVGMQSATVTTIQVSTVTAITGGSIVGLPGLTNSSSFQDFSLVSSGANGTDFDVLYVISSTSNTAGSITKYSFVGGSWVSNGSYTTDFGGFGIAAKFNGSGSDLYVSTGQGALINNRLIKLIDTSGYNSPLSITTANNVVLYTASGNNIIKGVAFAPIAPPTPVVNLAVSTNSASEEDETIVTVSANTSSAVFGDQTVDLSVSGAGIDGLDYVLSNTTITILNGQTSGSVTFTISDDGDIEGLETATLTISNPSSGMDLGTNLSEDINITDNDFDNFLPTIELSASTTNYLDGGNSGIASPYYISGVIADFTDPASTLGLDFTVADVETDVNSLVVSATSSNTSVVSNANLIISGFGATRNLQIVPSAVGNTTISVSVFDGIQSANYILNYSASQRTPDIDPSNTAWHTGISDASNSVGIDDTYFIAGDDELNVLNVYSRTESGLPYASFTYTSFLSLPEPGNPEVDLEAVAKSPVTSNRIFWTGSMSNGKSPFPDKPNRDRLFALDVTGTGSSTNFSFAGYTDISASLLAWGDANGYNFTTSAQAGVDSKAVDGFAVEGMVFGPDNTTLYVGMRAPLVPTATRTNAVIAPIQNFEAWFNNGSPVGMPTFGSPIELDLNLRGIRDIQRLSNGTYVIIAGSPTDTGSSDIYKWSGYPSDSPILVSSGGTVLNMEGIMQVNNGVNPDLTKVQVVSDGGTVVLYGDGIEAKDQGELNLRKFRSDVLTGLDLDICSEFTVTVEASGSTTLCDGETVELAAIGGTGSNTYLWSTGATTTSIVVGTSGNYSVTVTNLAGCSDVASVDVIVNAPSTWYLDADGDGYHVSSIVACVSPGPEYTLTSVLPNDCDDINPAANPGVSEDFCNGIDDDCDGLIDEGRIDGCTDALACNYNELSTCDDSSCEYATCADDDNDGLSNAEEIILGTDPNDNDSDNDGAFDGVEVNTYASNPLLQDTDGDGLTDGAEINSSLTSPTDTDTNDNGCSDFADLLGACDILGCTYEDAINYNALATIDDGTCTFPSGDSCPGDFDASGFVNTTDLLIFLTNYGSTCP